MDKNSEEFVPVETRAHTAAAMEDQVNQMMAMLAKMDEKMDARNKTMDEKMDARDEKMNAKIEEMNEKMDAKLDKQKDDIITLA